MIVNDSWYHFFNVGDSRTVLCADGAVKFATRDHKPDDSTEFHRIQNAGGFVSRGRVKGQLAVSRAFGDMEYKTKFSAHPREQMVHFVSPSHPTTPLTPPLCLSPPQFLCVLGHH